MDLFTQVPKYDNTSAAILDAILDSKRVKYLSILSGSSLDEFTDHRISQNGIL